MCGVGIDLSPLEKEQSFRSDFLFFISMVNGYIDSIFWDYFDFEKAKNDKKKRRRKKCLLDYIDEMESEGYISESGSNRFLVESLRKCGHGKPIDCFGKGFEDFLKEEPHCLPQELEGFPVVMRLGLAQKMADEHAIFFPGYEEIMHIEGKEAALDNAKLINEYFSNFTDMIANMRVKRNYLEHYSDGKVDKSDNQKIIETLGMFLLPSIHNLMVGRMKHYCAKLSDNECKSTQITIEEIEKILAQERKKRKERIKELYSFIRSKDNKRYKRNKTKRKSLANRDFDWKKEHELLGAEAAGYREHEFRIRYYFISKKRYKRIKELLGYKKDIPISEQNISFRRDIEPLFMLGVKVNFILHDALSSCINYNYEKELEKRYLKIKIGGSKAQKRRRSEIRRCKSSPDAASRRLRMLRKVRNPIAHNTMFWDIERDVGNENNKCSNSGKRVEYMEFDEVLSTVFEAIRKSRVKNHYEISSRMKSRLLDLFRRENYSSYEEKEDFKEGEKIKERIIFKKVKRWTPSRREELKKPRYKLRKRNAIKSVVGKWYECTKNVA